MAESEVSEDSAELSEEAASDMTEFDVPRQRDFFAPLGVKNMVHLKKNFPWKFGDSYWKLSSFFRFHVKL